MHPYDGTRRAGMPEGPALEVLTVARNSLGNQFATLEDGTWAFVWNLAPFTPENILKRWARNTPQ